MSAEESAQQPTQNQVPSQTWAAPAPAQQELGPMPGPAQQPPFQSMPQSPFQPALQPKQRKGWKIALIVIGIIIAIIAAIAGGVFAMQQSQQNDMRQIVHSKEADKAFSETLQGYDPLAFTDRDVIHSYTIDDGTIRHNPMGGIDVTVYVNGDRKLDVFFNLETFRADWIHFSGGYRLAA